MDDKCEGCGADMTIERTHWDGCHTSHKQCAAFKAGREEGLREAADIANQHGSVEGIAQKIERAILSAIGGGK